MSGSSYNKTFYHDQANGSLRSARIVVPKIIELTGATSVCDVGCGIGPWLKAYRENGISDVMGFDGPWVSSVEKLIPDEHFTTIDLSNPIKAPRRFGLAQTLEVAEHIEPARADLFVRFLTELSDIVVFGGAIPNQGGTHHVNEQWPDYWRAKFAAQGYIGLDPFRPMLWEEDDIDFWYVQNTFLFVHERSAQPFLQIPRMDDNPKWPERLVHPALVAHKDEIFSQPSLGYVVRKLPGALVRTVKHRFSVFRGQGSLIEG